MSFQVMLKGRYSGRSRGVHVAHLNHLLHMNYFFFLLNSCTHSVDPDQNVDERAVQPTLLTHVMLNKLRHHAHL